MGELQTIGGNCQLLFALAVQYVGERKPEVFGTIPNWAEHESRVQALRGKRNQLFERIGKEWQQADTLQSDLRSDGSALITFKLSGRAVTVWPRDNAGERLVNWMLANPEAKAA